MVQSLRLLDHCRGMGSIPGQGTKIWALNFGADSGVLDEDYAEGYSGLGVFLP